jgi:hypothetical protein
MARPGQAVQARGGAGQHRAGVLDQASLRVKCPQLAGLAQRLADHDFLLIPAQAQPGPAGVVATNGALPGPGGQVLELGQDPHHRTQIATDKEHRPTGDRAQQGFPGLDQCGRKRTPGTTHSRESAVALETLFQRCPPGRKHPACSLGKGQQASSVQQHVKRRCRRAVGEPRRPGSHRRADRAGSLDETPGTTERSARDKGGHWAIGLGRFVRVAPGPGGRGGLRLSEKPW